MREDWHQLDDKDFDELLRLMRLYKRDADRSKGSKAYVSGCVMAGAALEATLIAMLHCYGDEVTAAALPQAMRSNAKPLLKWKLWELLHVARAMHWLPAGLQIGGDWNTRRAKIGDYADALRQIRNLVHPAAYLQNHSPSRVTQRHLSRSLEILDEAISHFEVKVHAGLRKAMQLEQGQTDSR